VKTEFTYKYETLNKKLNTLIDTQSKITDTQVFFYHRVIYQTNITFCKKRYYYSTEV